MDVEVLVGSLRCGIVTWLLGSAAGRWAPRLLPARSCPPSERFLRFFLIAVVAGIASVAVLGACRILNAGAFALIAALGWAAARICAPPAEGAAGALTPRRWRILWPALVALFVLIPDTAVYLPAPPVNWDAMTYHLYFPARWLQEGRIFHIPTVFSDNSAAFAPQNGALFFAWQMALLGRDTLCNWSQVLCLIFLALAIYRTCLLLGGRRQPAVMAAAGLAWLAPLREWTYSANVDVFMIAFWFGAFYWLLAYLRRREAGTLLACGLATGLVAGTKTVGLPLAGLPAAVMVFDLLRERRLLRLLAFAAAAVGGGGWWYLVNAWRYGNPLFPLDFSLGGFRFPGAYDAQAVRDGIFHVEGFGEWVAIVARSYGVSTCLLLAIGLLALAWRALRPRRARAPRLPALLLLGFALFWIWFSFAAIPHNNQTRFLIPVLLVSLPGWALVLDGARRVHRAARPALFAVGLAAMAVASRPDLQWARSLERLGAAKVDVLSWFVLATLVCGTAVGALGYWQRNRRRWYAALLAAVLFWPTVAIAALHGDRSRIAFLAQADFQIWREGYLMFNDPALAPRRIAYTGANIPYAMMGNGWKHHVVYCNTQGRATDGFYDFWIRDPRRYPTYKPGIYRGRDDAERWLGHLEAHRIDTVVLFLLTRSERPAHWEAPEDFPIERVWVRRHPERFEPLLLTGVAEIYTLR